MVFDYAHGAQMWTIADRVAIGAVNHRKPSLRRGPHRRVDAEVGSASRRDEDSFSPKRGELILQTGAVERIVQGLAYNPVPWLSNERAEERPTASKRRKAVAGGGPPSCWMNTTPPPPPLTRRARRLIRSTTASRSCFSSPSGMSSCMSITRRTSIRWPFVSARWCDAPSSATAPGWIRSGANCTAEADAGPRRSRCMTLFHAPTPTQPRKPPYVFLYRSRTEGGAP